MQESETETILLKQEIKKKNDEIETLKNKLTECDVWFKNTYKYMTTSAKCEFKTAYQLAMEENPKGTTLRIRNNTGINLSNKLQVNSKDKSELKDKIEQFAIENSSESPDMRNEKKGIRYRHQYLATLYDDFIIQNPEIQVSLAVFCSYWPKNIIKPKPGDHAMCTCEKCENPALKLRALKTHKLINHEHELETVMRDIRQDNFESEEVLKEDLKKLLEEPIASKQVRYLEWTKVLTAEVNKNTGKQKQATTQRVPKVALAKDLAIEALADIELLKEHLERNLIIKKKIQEKKEEAIEVDNKAVIQVDWAQNGTIIVPDEAQAAFYGGRFDYSIHTGYQYSKEGSGGFASLSDENDHKAEAIHAALDPKIMELVEKRL